MVDNCYMCDCDESYEKDFSLEEPGECKYCGKELRQPLIFYMGKPVFEGDEHHQRMEEYSRAKKEGFEGNWTDWQFQNIRNAMNDLKSVLTGSEDKSTLSEEKTPPSERIRHQRNDL